MKKLLAGLGSLLVILGILAGVPAVLVWTIGNPLPTVDQLMTLATFRPDYGNTILLTKILPMIAWVAWALFAFPLVGEIFAAIRGRKTRKKVGMFRGQQQVAAKLVAAVAVMLAGIGVGAPAMASEAPTQPHVATSTVSASEEAASTTAAAERGTDHAEAERDEAGAEAHQVAPGETLWGIAEDNLGDGNRYGEIFEANRGVQNDGSTFSDPNLIQPGWEMSIPGTHSADPTPQPEPSSQASAEAPDEEPSAGGAGGSDESGSGPSGQVAVDDVPSVDEVPSENETPAEEQQAGQEEVTGSETSESATGNTSSVSEVSADEPGAEESAWALPLMTAGGIGSVLAAVLLSALGARRLLQRRRRKIGERISEPTADVAVYEQELAVVENGFAVADLDQSLRWLQEWSEEMGGKLPELLAVRLAETQIALYLEEPAELPAPFEAASDDNMLWTLPEGVSKHPSRPADAPYPALTSIGLDATGAMLLLDLERVGSLNVTGDETVAVEMIAAMSTELAGVPWGDQLQITLVGFPASLASVVGNYNVAHVDDVPALTRNLREELSTRRGALDSYAAIDVYEARAQANELDSWAPHLVFIAEIPDEDAREELVDLIAERPRLGVAVIARGDIVEDAATIEIESTTRAQYHSGGTLPPLPFAPQRLEQREQEQLRELFDVTEQPAEPADLVAEHPGSPSGTVDVALEDDIVDESRTIDDTATSEDAPAPADEELDDSAATHNNVVDVVDVVDADDADDDDDDADDNGDEDDDARDLEAVDAQRDAADDEHVSHDGEEPGDAITSDEADGVDAETAAATVPDWVPPRMLVLGPAGAEGLPEDVPGRTVEFLAYLALHDGAVPGDVMTHDLFPNTFDPKNNSVRQTARRIRTALGSDPFGQPLLPVGKKGVGFIGHAEITTDWHEFCDLIGPDLSRTSNEDLIAAVRLVRGIPFQGVAERRGWWTWRNIYESKMRQAIVDAAAELAERTLGSGDLSQARAAAQVAQSVDPLSGHGLCLELRVALKAGNEAECDRIIDALYEQIAGTEYGLDDEAIRLVETAQQKFPGLVH